MRYICAEKRKRSVRWYLGGGQSGNWGKSRRKEAVNEKRMPVTAWGQKQEPPWKLQTSGLWTGSACGPRRGGDERALPRQLLACILP